MKFLITCCSLIVLAEATIQSSTLELVQVFFRHGARTPEEHDTYPSDPYTIKDFMPTGWGQLTNVGKQKQFKLGQLLRKRYNAFLGDIYLPEMVRTQSTDFDRTKMSALLVLAGLFPPAAVQQWDNELAWMPIPFHFEKAENDFILRRPTHYCPAYLNEQNRVFKSDSRVLQMLEENRPILDYIAQNSGKPMETLLDVFGLYQTLNAEDTMNMTLPKWTQSVYPHRILELAARQCYFENSNDVLKRLNGGRSLSRVLKNIEAKMVNSTPDRKIYLYSGHENNVVNVLSALDLFEPHFPKYSSAVIVELHKFDNKEKREYKVAILYVRDVSDKYEPEVKRIDSCEAFCPYQQFVDITRPRIPINYTEECASSIPLD